MGDRDGFMIEMGLGIEMREKERVMKRKEND